jgi:hypothetical protein
MSRPARAVATALAVGTALLATVSTPTAGQQRAAAPNAALGRTLPRTPDGRPDFQGYWTNDSYTPLERPREFADKEFFTAEEAAAYLKKRDDQFLAQPKTDIHYDDAIWQTENYVKEANRRTSLIVDPRDGKLPPETPEARKRAAAFGRARDAADGADGRSLAERCITWGTAGPPMIPPTYNANLQIVQTRETVLIIHEMIHDVRVIPMDGRPHPDPKVRWLAGDSRGRWEGDTLVVDTTNFTDKTNFRGAPRNTRQDIFTTEALHVVERFTLAGPNEIRYEFTVEDPATWTRSWSGEVPIRRFDGPLYEYACHEGNYSLKHILMNARALEKDAAAAPRPR